MWLYEERLSFYHGTNAVASYKNENEFHKPSYNQISMIRHITLVIRTPDYDRGPLDLGCNCILVQNDLLGVKIVHDQDALGNLYISAIYKLLRELCAESERYSIGSISISDYP